MVIGISSDLDIGEYVVLRSSASKRGGPTAGGKSAFWFPDNDVKSGDLVILYTKRGTSSTKELGGGRIAHFYYWGLDEALWSSNDKVAVILEVGDWTSKAPP